MKQVITKEMLTELMSERKNICERVNAFICHMKKLQAHKGAQLDGVHQTSEGYWSAIRLPQWVRTETESKTYRFKCTETGEFISWVK